MSKFDLLRNRMEKQTPRLLSSTDSAAEQMMRRPSTEDNNVSLYKDEPFLSEKPIEVMYRSEEKEKNLRQS